MDVHQVVDVDGVGVPDAGGMDENLQAGSGAVCSVGGPLLVGDGMSDAVAHAFALPTGTVTFLLTDVEGSTKGWEASPQHMASAIARHYEILDEAIAANGGVRPVEQGEGDSVVAAFSRVSEQSCRSYY
jgi:class 3 adenylate cyclase